VARAVDGALVTRPDGLFRAPRDRLWLASTKVHGEDRGTTLVRNSTGPRDRSAAVRLLGGRQARASRSRRHSAPTPSAAEQAERAQVAAALAEVSTLDAAGLRARYPAGFTAALGYDPTAAANLPLIQASPLALNDGERAILKKNGFVISDRQRFPGFVYGYDSIYAHDLPLFVSADSILNAVHRSYDDLKLLFGRHLRVPRRAGRAESSVLRQAGRLCPHRAGAAGRPGAARG
jgi:hypothetical protein